MSFKSRTYNNTGQFGYYKHPTKEESRSKSRSHAKQEFAKWMKDGDHPICFYNKYGNPWNWD